MSNMKNDNQTRLIYSCKLCDYVTFTEEKYMEHCKKHNAPFQHYCKDCNFVANRMYDYKRHLLSHRHNTVVQTQKDYKCDICCKSYTNYKSYWSHKTICSDYNTSQTQSCSNDKKNNVSLDVIAQQDMFKQFMIDQNRQLMTKMQEMNTQMNEKINELANKETVIYNNNNNNTNNHFNLNLFLNVYCKDAMNLSDFMRSIDVQLHELEYIGQHGYVAGITKIITSRLSAMDICKRPIHCSDLRREVIHIRENNEWIKDIDGEKTRTFVYNVNIINYKSVGKWMIAHPQCEVLDTPEYNQWMEIAKQSVNPGEGKDKRNLTIFKNVIKMCHIDKDAFRILDIK